MIHPIISVSAWIEIPNETRIDIRRIFNLKRSGAVEVAGDMLLSDGTTATDLKELTVARLQEYLNSTDDDIYKLLSELINTLTKTPNEENKQIEGTISSGIKNESRVRKEKRVRKNKHLSVN